MNDLRHAQLVETKFPTSDLVVADYNVLDFQADPTGVKDSTAAIQAALDRASKDGGGTVWMPAGTYVLTDTVTVPPFCSLRGDWRDPDTEGSDYGTVIQVETEPGEWGPCCFLVLSCTLISGLTFFWPNQNAEKPIPYNYAISYPGATSYKGVRGSYMGGTMEDLTLLNAYKGIGLSATDITGRHENFRACHDMIALRNIKGSPLYRGLVAADADDHCIKENLCFNSSYWARAGKRYNAPDEEAIKAFTKAHGHAFSYSDCEWEMSINLSCADYLYGIRLFNGLRTQFIGQFAQVQLLRCQTAVRVENAFPDPGRAAQFVNCTLDGEISLQDFTGDRYINLANCKVTGKIGGPNLEPLPNLHIDDAEIPFYDGCDMVCPKVTRSVLYDVTQAPYFAPYAAVQTTAPVQDATAAIQKALDDAGAAGGGVVYLPAGWYRINSHLTIPGNVELRGCTSCTREIYGYSGGTVLMAYEGKGSVRAISDPALLTITGDNAGIAGLRVCYPENNPDYGVRPYPYAIRGSHKNMYVVNVGLTGAWYGIDFSGGCDGHYIRRVIGTCHGTLIHLGPSTHGTIQGTHTNIHATHRSGFNDIYQFPEEGTNYSQYAMADVGDSVVRRNEISVLIDGAENERIHGAGNYMTSSFCLIRSGSAFLMNNIVDNCANWGYHCYAPGAHAHALVANAQQYNGTLAHGNVEIHNRKLVLWRASWNVRL